MTVGGGREKAKRFCWAAAAAAAALWAAYGFVVVNGPRPSAFAFGAAAPVKANGIVE